MREGGAPEFWNRVRMTKTCWLWPGVKDAGGYGRIGRSKLEPKVWATHRYAWFLTYGPIPDGMDVLHRCDVPACVNPRHLWLGTDLDNARDREMKGRRKAPVGALNGCAKLTDQDIRKIRSLAKRGKKPKEIGAMFSVTRGTIGKIVRRESWTHV